MNTKRTFVVTIETEEKVEREAVQEYIKDAVESWGGQFRPDDPLFSANIIEVKVL